MAYQRFSDTSDLYIFQSNQGLNIWISENPTTSTVNEDGLLIENENVDQAVTLFRALYDLLVSNGSIVEINKRTNELKIRKNRK